VNSNHIVRGIGAADPPQPIEQQEAAGSGRVKSRHTLYGLLRTPVSWSARFGKGIHYPLRLSSRGPMHPPTLEKNMSVELQIIELPNSLKM
jgi:hypothetical protein